jgi:hypothetical protein
MHGVHRNMITALKHTSLLYAHVNGWLVPSHLAEASITRNSCNLSMTEKSRTCRHVDHCRQLKGKNISERRLAFGLGGCILPIIGL